MRDVTSQAAGTKWTYEDYLLLPDGGKRYEIIDGELFVTPAPATRHQRISGRLQADLWTCVEEHGLGQVFDAPTDVLLSQVDPDILFVARERLQIIKERNIAGAPDLVVEILSETTRKADEVLKRKRYERFGVREYWIVDPVLETAKVYRLGGAKFERLAELSREAADTLTTPLLRGFSLSLAKLFA